jgi:anhydro-N-acetylmuramic acid kinase
MTMSHYSDGTRIIGLMSGTSADGVDAAMVSISGQGRATRVSVLAFITRPFSPVLRSEILTACDAERARVDRLCVLNVALAEEYALAARAVADRADVPLEEVAAIACHGQTVWHQPQPMQCGEQAYRGTLQLGAPAVLAARTGCTVVSDFRSADMAAGGQGAPLVPYADWALLTSDVEARAVQNIGGIANVTYLPARGQLDDVIAFDTGPGNMVIDAVVAALTDGELSYDRDGAWAAEGTPSEAVIADMMESCSFFGLAPPKSTGREQFGRAFVEREFLPRCARAGLNRQDTVATATALTAETIADAYRRWLSGYGMPQTVIVGGGGASNATLIRILAERLSRSRVTRHDEFGIPDDGKEAIAFALLGYETLAGRPANVPSATGAAYRAVLGSITPPPRERGLRWSANHDF